MISGNSDDSDAEHKNIKGAGGKNDDDKQSNTIMQQINNFTLIPMNDNLAEKTIEDHKYLLELVENRCAIAFYSVSNRNQALYEALRYHYGIANEVVEDKDLKKTLEVNPNNTDDLSELDILFLTMITKYDFMSVVMYPDLRNRREFVHDCWMIA